MNNTSFEPMDVDSSANSNSQMDVSYTEPLQNSSVHITDRMCFTPVSVKEETQALNKNLDTKCPAQISEQIIESHSIPDQVAGVKVYHIVKKNNYRKLNFTSTHIAVSIIIVSCLSVLAYQIFNINCSGELDPSNLSEKLHKKVYGQYMAVTDIVNAIKSESSTKMLFFYGGTGVGKTYTVSLMLENSWNYTNIYHYTMPSFLTKFTAELIIGMTICNTAIFVVDDLSPTDLRHLKSHIMDVIKKNNELNKDIVIILVFNCDNSDKDLMRKCDDAFYKELEESFKNINALKQYVKFEQLSEQHLKKCIEDEVGHQIDEYRYKNILKNFNVSMDGCKGVHKKIKFLSNL